jgi:hypothetical protein
MVKLLAALALAGATFAVTAGAHAAPGMTREAFSSQQAAQAALPAARFPFDLAELQAARLTVSARDTNGDSFDDEYLLWRDGDALVSQQGPLEGRAAAAFNALAKVPAAQAAGQPALGLHSCGEETPEVSNGSLQVELTVLLRGRKALRLRSDARCENMLPWNGYDGERLTVHTAREAGQGLIALAQAMCGQCLQSLWPPGPVKVRAAGQSGFDEHYAALRANWQGPDAPALLQALDWIDHSRLVAALGRDGVRPLITALQVQRWGYVDRKGAFKLARKYERAEAFIGDTAFVKFDGLWQSLDRQGQLRAIAVPPAYRAPMAKGETALRCDFPDVSGRAVIAASFDELGPFRGELAAARKGDAWGFVNTKGRWVVPARFEQVLPFSDGLAAVRQKGRWGYIDVRGRVVITPRYFEAGSFSKGLAPVR